MKTKQYCGLCKVNVGDWRKHITSKAHKHNLRDFGKTMQAARDHHKGVQRRQGGEIEYFCARCERWHIL